MTDTLESVDLEEMWAAALPCECRRDKHHPGRQQCGEPPAFLVRLRHATGCAGDITVKLCQPCLQEAIDWAAGCVGKECPRCHKPVAQVSELIGAVVTL